MKSARMADREGAGVGICIEALTDAMAATNERPKERASFSLFFNSSRIALRQF